MVPRTLRATAISLVATLWATSTSSVAGGPPDDVGVQPAQVMPHRDSVADRSDSETFQLLPGFQVELLYTVPKGEQGSWVALAVDPKGRIIASDQGGQGLYRITPSPIGSSDPTRVAKLDIDLSSAQGLLYAFDSLYVSVNGGDRSGFYRARDTNGDDQFDEVVKLKALHDGGEHGCHAIRLGPHGDSLYLVAGNHTYVPADLSGSRITTNWGEDLLLPRQWDAGGHAVGAMAPGGWIVRIDPEGERWEMVSVGYRNPYSMDFNDDGELFAYDADMEWDMGMPWYRPTRVVHATSGSDFGWRSGSGKWPTYYADSLPAVIDIGPGSPVGATFGRGAKFPARYQHALYLLDWTFGTMYAVHLSPEGASYRATKEEFLSRAGLPLTDAVVGRDGALYFAVGGRGSQSALYRVRYVGDQPTNKVDGRNATGADLRALRRRLEAYHGRPDPTAVDTAWPYLGHADRHIRYAARMAIEHQAVATWQRRALAETNPQARALAMVALARHADPSVLPELVERVCAVDLAVLDEPVMLDVLRAVALALIRLRSPDEITHGHRPYEYPEQWPALSRLAPADHQIARRLVRHLDPHFPAKSAALNQELSRLLVYLESPAVITEALGVWDAPVGQSLQDLTSLLSRNNAYGQPIANVLANHPEVQKVYYAFVLRNLRYGWTLEQRKAYFAWLDEARQRTGGNSYGKYIENIRQEAWANLSEAEKAAIGESELPPAVNLEELPRPQGPGKKWTVDEVVALAAGGLQGRDFENGRTMFAAARCVACHRFDGAGGATGPDVTNVAGRFSVGDLAESLVDPSRVVSDQYQTTTILTDGGRVISGRVVGSDGGVVSVQTDAYDPHKIERIPEAEIERREPSRVSLMPVGLLDLLNGDEVSDLLAYLLSRGDPDDPMFTQ